MPVQRACAAAIALLATVHSCFADPIGEATTWTLNRVRPWVNEHLWDIEDFGAEYDRSDGLRPGTVRFRNLGPAPLMDLTLKMIVQDQPGTFTFTMGPNSAAVGELASWGLFVRQGESPPPQLGVQKDSRGRELRGPALDTSVCIGAYNGLLRARRYMLLLFKLTPSGNGMYSTDIGGYVQKLQASGDDKRCAPT